MDDDRRQSETATDHRPVRRCARVFPPHGSRRGGNVGDAAPLPHCHCGLVERHDGRIVNTWGDAVIAEFASVVEAVQCAVEIQQEISNQESDPPHAHRMRFRIGINLGDVMVDGSDIYGDGVNIAARLQELAEPGGVVISGPVYDQVHNKLSLGFDCLGQQQMKNVAPVISYRVAMAAEAARGSFQLAKAPLPRRMRVAASDAGASRVRDETRAGHVDALRLGLVGEPASPHCYGPGGCGLSGSDQCSSRACTGSGSIGQSQYCCSLSSYGQCSGANPRRTEKRSAERVASERAHHASLLASARAKIDFVPGGCRSTIMRHANRIRGLR